MGIALFIFGLNVDGYTTNNICDTQQDTRARSGQSVNLITIHLTLEMTQTVRST
jgi:hypothetical protein